MQSIVKGVSFTDVSILESTSGIYKRDEHERWMCILIYLCMSSKAQRLDRHWTMQFLLPIRDTTTYEI